MQSKTDSAKPACPEPPGEVGNGEGSNWDKVDESVWESFPASDPPASWAGSDSVSAVSSASSEEGRVRQEQAAGGGSRPQRGRLRRLITLLLTRAALRLKAWRDARRAGPANV
jgi:hypothetical protein